MLKYLVINYTALITIVTKQIIMVSKFLFKARKYKKSCHTTHIKTTLTTLLILTTITLSAQTTAHHTPTPNTHQKISTNAIIGNWYSTDSNAHKITFIKTNNHFVEIDGIRHGVSNYLFTVDGDSMSVKGTASNWPPYDCNLKLLNAKLLEIEFYYLFSTAATKVTYKR
jgi:hypothetical protein